MSIHSKLRQSGLSDCVVAGLSQLIDSEFTSGTGGLVDCAEDSAAAAAFVAEWLTSPVSRHCDC